MSETAFEDLTPPSLETQPETAETPKTEVPAKPAKTKGRKKQVTAPAAEGESAAEPAGQEAPKSVKSKLSKLYPEDAVIRLTVEGNPKKPGSWAHKAFACYKDGMTVGDFFAATADLTAEKDGEVRKRQATYGTITYDVGHGYIKVEV